MILKYAANIANHGEYLLCEAHNNALTYSPYAGLAITISGAPGEGACDACAKKGLDYAYILVQKRAKESSKP